ncbi:MAG: hypothetical protein H6853_00950 [Rhodospirillales bacterium]|nr:hypothetical protein [Alphaproteobacteria bacterium]USO03882.1 MAG: hypothetical protein H6853_00950 [Rhodospirillales bacterium]
MKKLLTSALVLGSVVALGACQTTQSNMANEQDETETLTQAPYADDRTVGPNDPAPVRSAEPVFEERQMK